MASPEITNYITQNLQLGYDIKSIKKSLIQSGYTTPQINAAIDYVSAQQTYQGNTTITHTTAQSHSTTHTKPLLVLSALLLFAIGIGLFVIFSGTDTTTQTAYQPPYQQFEEGVQQTVTSNSQDDSSDRNTQPVQRQPTRTTTQTAQPSYLSRLEIDETVAKIAASQPLEALKLCAQIITRQGTFSCIIKVSLESKDFTYCEGITDVSARDNCYVQFGINDLSDERVCHKIANTLKQNGCFELYDIRDQIAEAEKLPVYTQDELAALAAQAALSGPSQDEIEAAATSSSFANIDDTLDDELAV